MATAPLVLQGAHSIASGSKVERLEAGADEFQPSVPVVAQVEPAERVLVVDGIVPDDWLSRQATAAK
jgi:hypothetical protein